MNGATAMGKKNVKTQQKKTWLSAKPSGGGYLPSND